MKKLCVLTLMLALCSGFAYASSYQTQKYYKLTERNSRGQKVGTTRVYYRGDKSNITKVEKYNTNGRREKLYR